MRHELVDAQHLDAQDALTTHQLMDLSGLAETVLRELVEYGALEPIDIAAQTWTFTSNVVVVARTACRLQRDFELDPHALAVVLRFVERIDLLQAELQRLRARRGA